MAKDINKKRKQDLGIFYTPQEVVDFIYDILNIWKNKEDKETHRWQSRKPRAHYPSVIDPACGEGVFLKTAVTSGFTGYHPTEKTPYVFGVDMDGDVVKRWEKISILHDLFKGNKTKMLNHFHQQDGLLELPEKVFNYKTGGLKEFDAVVGNPPYGGIGFSSLKDNSTKESIEILEHLRRYEVLVYKKKKNPNENQEGLFGSLILGTTLLGGGASLPQPKEVEALPIEILFVDRFIQLAKPGGWIAIIIPDGILTNSNSNYVREFISNRTKVEAIVSLPRETFKNAGTSAKTSILFLKKLNKDEKPKKSYPVFLASVEKVDKCVFEKIVNYYEKFYNSERKHMNKSNLVQITKDQTGREAVMVRVDKTLKELMEEKPESRWDPNYWHPRYEELINSLKQGIYQIRKISDFIKKENITQGDIARKHIGEKYLKQSNYRLIEANTFEFTGLNLSKSKFISEEQYIRLQRTSPKNGDILFVRSGSIGKLVGITRNLDSFVLSGHVNRIFNLKGINSFYLLLFLLTRYGQAQLERQQRGVAVLEINFNEFNRIYLPLVSKKSQNSIEFQYRKISIYHDKAMEEKKKKNEKGYKENLEKAEKMLQDLIKKTEEVIEGKRKDVN